MSLCSSIIINDITVTGLGLSIRNVLTADNRIMPVNMAAVRVFIPQCVDNLSSLCGLALQRRSSRHVSLVEQGITRSVQGDQVPSSRLISLSEPRHLQRSLPSIMK
jgi:hypothetical protein